MSDINPATGMPFGVRLDGCMIAGGQAFIQFTDAECHGSTFYVPADKLDRDGLALATACARLREPYLRHGKLCQLA